MLTRGVPCAQGDCPDALPAAITAAAAADPPLAKRKAGQCVLLTDDRIIQWKDKTTPTWVSNLLLRFIWDTPGEAFRNMLGVDTAVVWFTDITFQGDTTPDAKLRGVDPWSQASIYFAGMHPTWSSLCPTQVCASAELGRTLDGGNISCKSPHSCTKYEILAASCLRA